MSRLKFMVVACALASASCGSSTPTSPSTTTPVTVTDTFSDSLSINGANTHQIVVSASGLITASLIALQPDAASVVGLQIGSWTGAACAVPVISNDRAGLNQTLVGQADRAGNLCVRVYDVGKLTETITYQVQVVHP